MKTYITRPAAKNLFFAHKEVGFEVVDTSVCHIVKLNNEVKHSEKTKKFASVCNYFLKEANMENKQNKIRFFKED